MRLLPRTLSTVIDRASETFPAIVMTGPRQSGKTTLLCSDRGESHSYLSLEDPDTRARVHHDPRGVLDAVDLPVILDEIQYVPELLSYVKTRIDASRVPGQWLITGSQGFGLMEGVSQSLAGRAAVVHLLPLSIGESAGDPAGDRSLDEILESLFGGSPTTGPSPCSLDDWLLRGGYPELRANRRVDRSLWCASYIQTYLERDVRNVLGVGDLNAFGRFLRLAAARTAQILNYSDLARDVGVSPPTIRSWLSVLEAGGIVFLLQPWFENYGKRLVKNPKLYFLDTALATYLTAQHASEPMRHGPMFGALVETAVVSAWVKAFVHRGETPSLYYWRTRDGIEVDLLVERNGHLYAIEVKSTSTIVPAHAASLAKWRRLAGSPEARCVIMAPVTKPTHVIEGVTAVPWWVV